MKIKTRSDFIKKFPVQYKKIMIDKGEAKEALDRLLPGRTKWTFELCKIDARRYTTRTEWSKNSGAYSAAQRNNWLIECCKHMTETFTFWEKDSAIKDAKKYSIRSEWKSKSGGAYGWAKSNGCLEECLSHMESRLTFRTVEDCVKSAKQYKTRESWKKGDPRAYSAARRNGSMKQCCGHMSATRVPWTKEMCKEDALKYTRRFEWQKNSNGYIYALRHGWLEECVSHMKKKITK